MNQTNNQSSQHSEQRTYTWTLLDIIIIGVGTGLTFLLLFFLFSQLVFSSDPALTGSTAPTTIQSLGLAVLEAIGLLAGVYVFGLRRKNYRWRDIGFTSVSYRWWSAAVSISIVIIPITGLITFLVMIALGLPLENPQLEFLIPEDFSWFSGIGMLLLGGILVPIAEEVVFRGVLYTWLRERWGIWIGVIISSLIFAVVHIDIAIAVTAFVLAIVLALIYEYSKSLWPSIAIHAINNSVKIILIYLFLILDIPINI